MGTRCLTITINEDGYKIMSMYRQFDGYPDGHGLELANFLNGMVIGNGIGIEEEKLEKFANGMGCLSAQIVNNFKENPGGIYLYPTSQNVSVSYIYTVTTATNRTNRELIETKIECMAAYNKKVLFNGSPADLLKWIEDGSDEEID